MQASYDCMKRAIGTKQQRRAAGHTFHPDLRGALVTLVQTSSQVRQLANKCVFVSELLGWDLTFAGPRSNDESGILQVNYGTA